MAENRTVTAIYITEPFLVALDRSRGAKPRSAYLAGLVEQDVDKPGIYDGSVRQVPRSKADKRVTLSLRGGVVEKANRRRGDLPLATYSASVILTALDKLERKLAYEDHRRRCEREEAERLAREEAEQQASIEAAHAGRTCRARAHSPSSKAQHTKRKPRKKPKNSPQPQQHLRGGRSRVERRPRPRGEIRLPQVPEGGCEVRTPSPIRTRSYLDELEAGVEAEKARLRAQRRDLGEQQPAKPGKPASSESAVSAVEKLAPPPSPNPPPPPSPSTHRGSQEPYTPPEPFGAQEPTMNQIPPRRPPTGLGPRVVERPQEELAHADLLALLQRHEAGQERFPAVVPVAALDGEGGRAVHAALSTNLKGAGDALRIIVGVEDQEVVALVGPGVVDATWARLLTLLESLASRLGCVINVTPHIAAIPLEDNEGDTEWEWEEDDEDDDEQEAEVDCGHVLLIAIQAESASGRLGAFPSSSMW